VLDQLATLVLPLLPAAVDQPGVLVAVVLEVPDEPGGKPVVVVAVDDHGIVGADPLGREQLLQLLLREQVADRPGLQVLAPVQPAGALDVTGVVGAGVDVDLDDLDPGVAGVGGSPLGIDQHLGVRVFGSLEFGGGLGHLPLLSLKLTNWIHKLNNSEFPSLRAQARKGQLVIRPVEMSQAAQYAPAGPDQPATRPGRTRLFLVPLGIVVLLLAIPGGAYGFARNQLS